MPNTCGQLDTYLGMHVVYLACVRVCFQACLSGARRELTVPGARAMRIARGVSLVHAPGHASLQARPTMEALVWEVRASQYMLHINQACAPRCTLLGAFLGCTRLGAIHLLGCMCTWT